MRIASTYKAPLMPLHPVTPAEAEGGAVEERTEARVAAEVAVPMAG